jgi:hypothetical protein
MPEPVTITIAKTLWDLAKSLFELSAKFREQDAKRRDEVSRYFGEIADCLGRTHTKLAQGTYPHGECAALGMHADHLEQVIGDYVGHAESRAFAEQLKAVHRVEIMFGEIQQDTGLRDRELPKLAAAAGVFQALSKIVAASPP